MRKTKTQEDKMREYTNKDFCSSGFRGAVYFPARAYNAYQTYEYYDPAEIDRDFGYAEKAGLTALRIFTSFEQWQKDGDGFFDKFENLLQKAMNHGIKVMPILFEHCGRDFTVANALDRDPDTAVCVRSPALSVVRDESRWGACYDYIDAFYERFDGDIRICAVEIMNEPDLGDDVAFAKAMLKRAWDKNPKSAVSMAFIVIGEALIYSDMLDVMQFHVNFPTAIHEFRRDLELGRRVQEATGKPVWLSEWQRLRTSGGGWDVAEIPEEAKCPALHTLAEDVWKSGLGSFFWCLMVKPAYLSKQRPNGTFNGLFHEDGSVYSLDDLEAISGRRYGEERKERPEWFLSDLREKRSRQ